MLGITDIYATAKHKYRVEYWRQIGALQRVLLRNGHGPLFEHQAASRALSHINAAFSKLLMLSYRFYAGTPRRYTRRVSAQAEL